MIPSVMATPIQNSYQAYQGKVTCQIEVYNSLHVQHAETPRMFIKFVGVLTMLVDRVGLDGALPRNTNFPEVHRQNAPRDTSWLLRSCQRHCWSDGGWCPTESRKECHGMPMGKEQLSGSSWRNTVGYVAAVSTVGCLDTKLFCLLLYWFVWSQKSMTY